MTVHTIDLNAECDTERLEEVQLRLQLRQARRQLLATPLERCLGRDQPRPGIEPT